MQVSLIEFSLENYKIFKEKATFSMLARKNDEHTFESNGEHLLKTSLIYGPNASGKTSLFDAITVMKNLVVNSTNNQEGAFINYPKFLLSNQKDKPTSVEVIFSLGEKVFKYSFSVLDAGVFEEFLLEVLPNGKERKHFTRNEQSFKLFYDFKKSVDVITKTRKEVLFLSAASQWNNELAMEIVRALKDNINIVSGLQNDNYSNFTVALCKNNPESKKQILKFLKKADFCIEDITVDEIEIPEPLRKQFMLMNGDQQEIPSIADTVNFSHAKFNTQKEQIGFEKINRGAESMGTQKFFDVLGPIIDTLENGKVLLIDEFDNSLHPLLTKFIVDLFKSTKTNPHNAQLIVTTHDTSLLSHKEDFIKDQFWFTEKDEFGAAKLFSLAEFDMRNDTEYAKKYLEGRFGALPFVESINK